MSGSAPTPRAGRSQTAGRTGETTRRIAERRRAGGRTGLADPARRGGARLREAPAGRAASRLGTRTSGAPGLEPVGGARRGGRFADARTARRGPGAVGRGASRGNTVRRGGTLASRPVVVNNYIGDDRRGRRGFRRYRGRHRHGIPHIHGSYFYFPGYSTFSLGVAVGAGLRYYDPYWYGAGLRHYHDPYWYGYYGHGYGYTAWNPGPRYDYYTGSLRLKVRPRFAEVYVDGYYAGRVDDYDGVFQRLRLEEGAHHIEIRRAGHAPLEFEVMILPGETITYEGYLEPL